MYHGRLVPAPPSMPAPPPPVHEVEDEPVVDIAVGVHVMGTCVRVCVCMHTCVCGNGNSHNEFQHKPLHWF